MKVDKRFDYRAGRGRIRVSSGQTVLEMALLLPLMLLLLVGVIEIGRFAYFDILVSNVRERARSMGRRA